MTVNELKEIIDEWVDEGHGDLMVVFLYNDELYKPSDVVCGEVVEKVYH